MNITGRQMAKKIIPINLLHLQSIVVERIYVNMPGKGQGATDNSAYEHPLYFLKRP